MTKQVIMKRLSFGLMGLMVVLLIVASVCEKVYGTAFAVQYFYTAPYTILLWAAAAISALVYLVQQRVYKVPVTFLLHLSFLVILSGALVTHLWGKQGEISLRLDAQTNTYQLTDGKTAELPFALQLTDFEVAYYPGTQAPMDFISHVKITDENGDFDGIISMNNILNHRHYRFYQARYDSDGLGSTFAVSYDPAGIAITYTGYALLLVSILLFFFQKRTHFRALVRSLSQKNLLKASLVLLLFLPVSLQANEATPRTLQRPLAASWGDLYVYYNNRVCPMQTLCKDFTTKLYGKPTYKGLTAEQVATGWIFYYDDWANEPMVKVKGDAVKAALGIEGKYASLNDFYGRGRYKLDDLLRAGDKNAKAADEKVQLISMLCTGTMLQLFPMGDGKWISTNEMYSVQALHDDRQFMVGSINFIAHRIATGQYNAANEGIIKLRVWQQRKAGWENIPSEMRFKAEQLYNRIDYTKPLAMTCATLGILLFVLCCILLSRGATLNSYVHYTLTGLMVLLALFLTAALALRWVVSGHIPLSNGFETMQFMAWIASLATAIGSVCGHFKYRSAATPLHVQLLLPFGFLICGMTLMVSMMSAANPQITLLMPVLQSPLLTAHVAIIMMAYCLLAFVMLNGLTAIIVYGTGKIPDENGQFEGKRAAKNEQIERLQTLSQILLYPAIFCLTIGIFIGAVWANISWGRYWGWDPKEVWALLTMLVYAALLHTNSLRFLRRPMVFHIYSVVAFLFVLFTYFGVNFLLGGMHSYA